MSESQEQGASPEESVRALGVELLQLNLDAYREGHHGLAHHLLSAALHCAQGSCDRDLAEGIWQRAEDQRGELKRSPEGLHGTSEGARGRGMVTMFESVALMAASVSQRLRSRPPPHPGMSFIREVGQVP